MDIVTMVTYMYQSVKRTLGAISSRFDRLQKKNQLSIYLAKADIVLNNHKRRNWSGVATGLCLE